MKVQTATLDIGSKRGREEMNLFLKDKDVIDIKFSSIFSPSLNGIALIALIIYRDEERNQ